MHSIELSNYGLVKIAEVRIEANEFRIDVTDDACVAEDGGIYAFVINDEIVRVGSSAAPLRKRLAAWRRDVSKALGGGKSSTPLDEAERWREALAHGSRGAVFARRATLITTPVGTFTAHLDEERVLLARHRPKLNRSSR